MKICVRCKESKPLECFANFKETKDGKQSWCKDCFRVYLRHRHRARPLSPQPKRKRTYNRRYEPKKQKARWLVHQAVNKGELVRPAECDQCGRGKCRIEGHHEDYDKPLDVEWLCKSCHSYRHSPYQDEIGDPNEPKTLDDPRQAEVHPEGVDDLGEVAQEG